MNKNNYNLLAPYYDFLARSIFGKSILNAKHHFLHVVPSGAKILIAGGGTGQILPTILALDPQNHVVYLEKSSKMISISSKRLDKSMKSRVNFIEGDESKLPHKKFDVVITNFFLDQFKEDRLQVLLSLFFDRLDKTGIWLFSDFQLQKQHAHYWWQKYLVKIMITFFKLTTKLEVDRLSEFDPYFDHLNLQLIEEERFFKSLIVSRVYQKAVTTG